MTQKEFVHRRKIFYWFAEATRRCCFRHETLAVLKHRAVLAHPRKMSRSWIMSFNLRTFLHFEHAVMARDFRSFRLTSAPCRPRSLSPFEFSYQALIGPSITLTLAVTPAGNTKDGSSKPSPPLTFRSVRQRMVAGTLQSSHQVSISLRLPSVCRISSSEICTLRGARFRDPQTCSAPQLLQVTSYAPSIAFCGCRVA